MILFVRQLVVSLRKFRERRLNQMEDVVTGLLVVEVVLLTINIILGVSEMSRRRKR